MAFEVIHMLDFKRLFTEQATEGGLTRWYTTVTATKPEESKIEVEFKDGSRHWIPAPSYMSDLEVGTQIAYNAMGSVTIDGGTDFDDLDDEDWDFPSK